MTWIALGPGTPPPLGYGPKVHSVGYNAVIEIRVYLHSLSSYCLPHLRNPTTKILRKFEL